MSTSSDLVSTFVEDVLNGHELTAVGVTFHPRFVDRDPLDIPGVPLPDGGSSRRSVEAQVRLLSSPGVDIRFTLEDVFDDGGDRVGYRLFGEGSLPLTGEFDSSIRGPDQQVDDVTVRRLDVAGTGLVFERGSLRRSQAVQERLPVTYGCVGIFRAERGQLVERWGRVHLA